MKVCGMRHKKVIRNLETEARSAAADLARFDDVGLRRTQSGYYYIAHYYPLRAMDDIVPSRALDLLQSATGNGFELYFHIPFCQVRCAFCHFFKEVSASPRFHRQDELVELLIAELKSVRHSLGRIRAHSIQFGGGTPSYLDNRLLARLLDAIRINVEIDPGCEIKFEIYPQRHEHDDLSEKLTLLGQFGVTDLVIDLESGNQQSLRQVGRANSSLEIYLDLVKFCADRGFDSIITALMIGMPDETMESLLGTLDVLVSTKEVGIINAFPFIMRDPDPVADLLKKNPQKFHSARSRDEMSLLTRDFLASFGFEEGPIAYFRRKGRWARQQSDKFECVNLLGFGPSAFGYLNGEGWAAQTFNDCTFDGYRSRVRAGKSAMWRAGILDQFERARRKLIFGLANCKTEPLFEIENRYGVSIDALVGRELNAFLHLGLIEVDLSARGIRYTPSGLARLEEMSYFLGGDFVKNRCAEPVQNDAVNRQELLRHHYYISVAPDDRALFENYVAQFEREFMWRLPPSCRAGHAQLSANVAVVSL
jgi:oxygen-independent coproporphyrinogen-3 oxidase